MRLTDLEPQFTKIIDPTHFQNVDSLAEADGIWFLCPKCFGLNGGRPRTHMVLCWRPHVPQTIAPRPGRWEFEGTGYHDLTLKAGSSSILLTGDKACQGTPGWHGYVTNGEVTSC